MKLFDGKLMPLLLDVKMQQTVPAVMQLMCSICVQYLNTHSIPYMSVAVSWENRRPVQDGFFMC
jgi:hypothetical protein